MIINYVALEKAGAWARLLPAEHQLFFSPYLWGRGPHYIGFLHNNKSEVNKDVLPQTLNNSL